ncbi:hypothetical protein JW766_06190 [Candidatus Dojkabacteria bacterium]|nr:hypothetical protein [Candidatus Dojkabacteria bacterium]
MTEGYYPRRQPTREEAAAAKQAQMEKARELLIAQLQAENPGCEIVFSGGMIQIIPPEQNPPQE